MLKKKFLIGFLAVAISIAVLVGGTLLLLADNTLKNAGKNCDTIKINATLEKTIDGWQLRARQSIEYKNRTAQPMNEIKFHIYANAYKENAKNPPVEKHDEPTAYPNGKSFGGIHVTNVKNNGLVGAGLGFSVDGDDDTTLIVPLNATLNPNKKVTVDMEYLVKIANIKHRLGWTDDAVNVANFYPVPCMHDTHQSIWHEYPYSANGDPFYNAVHNFDVTITAPADLTLAHSGSVVKSTEKSGMIRKTIKSTSIRDFAMVFSSKFQSVSKRFKGAVINYFYLNDDNPVASLDVAVKSVETFSNLFVKYPYKQLSVVQTDFLHGGMEYGELVYISRDLLKTKDGTPADVTARSEHAYVIVHEIAHQWWYGMVGNNQNSTAWIDEGLAEYSTMLFFDRNPEFNLTRQMSIDNAKRNYSAYVKLVREIGAKLDTNMNRDLDEFNTSFEYVYMTYIRGFLLFCDLESILTHDKLINALSAYARDTMFEIASQETLVAAIEKHTGTRVTLFFSSYLKGWDGFK